MELVPGTSRFKDLYVHGQFVMAVLSFRLVGVV